MSILGKESSITVVDLLGYCDEGITHEEAMCVCKRFLINRDSMNGQPHPKTKVIRNTLSGLMVGSYVLNKPVSIVLSHALGINCTMRVIDYWLDLEGADPKSPYAPIETMSVYGLLKLCGLEGFHETAISFCDTMTGSDLFLEKGGAIQEGAVFCKDDNSETTLSLFLDKRQSLALSAYFGVSCLNSVLEKWEKDEKEALELKSEPEPLPKTAGLEQPASTIARILSLSGFPLTRDKALEMCEELFNKPVVIAIDLPKHSLTYQINRFNLGITTTVFNQLLLNAGFIEKKEVRFLDDSTNEVLSLTEKGLKYGSNKPVKGSKGGETMPRYYDALFEELKKVILGK